MLVQTREKEETKQTNQTTKFDQKTAHTHSTSTLPGPSFVRTFHRHPQLFSAITFESQRAVRSSPASAEMTQQVEVSALGSRQGSASASKPTLRAHQMAPPGQPGKFSTLRAHQISRWVRRSELRTRRSLPFTRLVRGTAVCWNRFHLGAGVYASQQLQGLHAWRSRDSRLAQHGTSNQTWPAQHSGTRARDPSTSTASLLAQTRSSSPKQPLRAKAEVGFLSSEEQSPRASSNFHSQSRWTSPSSSSQSRPTQSKTKSFAARVGGVPCGPGFSGQ